MKPNHHYYTDGFTRRRTPADRSMNQEVDDIPARFLDVTLNDEPIADMNAVTTSEATTAEVKQLLQSLSIDDGSEPNHTPSRSHDRDKRPRRRLKKKWVIGLIIALLLIALCLAGYLFIKGFIVTGNVFNGGNILSLIEPGTPLKTDAQGRTNILLFGTSQDDSAHQNAQGGGGLWLTDSIELVSIDQKQKTVKLVGIPRDLWVPLENCQVGTYAKINAVYECGANLLNSSSKSGLGYAAQDKAGAQQLMNTVAEVTGITPQYYVHADYTVLKQAVDAVGGIDVDIVGDGASGIYDTNFDWDCPNGPYTCKNVYYPNNGVYHLTGTQALFLSRARADSGLYSYKDFGLNRGDFDRQANQQKVLIALQAKVKTASVLANPVALNGLLDAFGNNISTNLSAGETKTLLTFSKVVANSSVTQVSLVQPGSEVVTTGMISGQSVVVPTSGAYDFSSISGYLTKQLSTNPAVSEGATIAVYNASGRSGAAGAEQTKLEQLGFTVDTIGDAASRDIGTGAYTLYDQSLGKMPQTLAQLQTQLGTKATTANLPADITSGDDFIIIINQ